MAESARYVPSTWKRIFAWLVDRLVIALLFFPFWGFWYLLGESEDVIFVPLWLFGFLILFPMLYEFLFLALFQQTPGQWVWDLWVVPRHHPGARLRWEQAFLRALSGRLCLFFSYAPYALAFFRYDRTHLCDWIAETRVLQAERRHRPPRLRWITGSFLVFIYVSQGFQNALLMADSIDWGSKRVDIQEALDGGSLENLDFFDVGDDSLSAE